MKASFNLPTSTYNIILTKEELDLLKTTNFVGMPVSRIPCKSSRGIIDKEFCFKSIGVTSVPHNLRFDLTETIAGIEPNDWHVQFFNIIVEEEELSE